MIVHLNSQQCISYVYIDRIQCYIEYYMKIFLLKFPEIDKYPKLKFKVYSPPSLFQISYQSYAFWKYIIKLFRIIYIVN